MPVILTQEVEGLSVGDIYTGANEAYLLASGYARKAKSGEVQTLTEGGAGLTSFTLTHSGQTTGAIAANASAATVQTALEALSNLAPGDVAVSGAAGGPYTVRFAEGVTHALLTATPTGGTGTITVANVGVASFTGPGLDNTGPADTTIANNREFTPVAHQIAETSNLPQGGTNDGIVLKDPEDPTYTYTGTDGPTPYPAEDPDWTGFANEPANGWPLEVSSVTKADGSAATGLPAAGGTVLKVTGRGFRKATGVKFGGTNGTALTIQDDQHLTVTTPAKAAGSYTVQVVRGSETKDKANAVTFV